MTEAKTGIVRPSKAPNLPIAPVEYNQTYIDQVLNALRLYFAQIDNAITSTVNGSATTTGTASQLLANDGSGGFANVNVGSGLLYSGGILSATAASPTGTAVQLLANDGSGGFANVNVGSGLTYAGGTLSSSASTSGTASYYGTPFTGAYSRPYNDMFGDVRSINDFFNGTPGLSSNWDSALQAAIDSIGAGGGLVYFPPINYQRTFTSTFTISGKSVIIDGCQTYMTYAANTTLFSIDNAYNVVIKNMVIIGDSGLAYSPSSFIVDTTINTGAIHVVNVTCLYLGSGFRFRGNYFYVSQCKLDQLIANGIGIQVSQTGGGDGLGWISDTSIGGRDAPNRAKAAVYVTDGVAIHVTSCDFMQAQHSLLFQPAAGVAAIGSWKCVNTFFDTFDVAGVMFDNSVNATSHFQRMTFADCWMSWGAPGGSAPQGTGFLISSGAYVDSLLIDSCEFFGDSNGIFIDNNCNLTNIGINNCVISGSANGYTANSDIAIGTNNQNFTISNCFTGAYGGYGNSTNGVYINGGCNNYVVTGNQINNFVDLGGSNKVITNNIINAGSTYQNGLGYTYPVSVSGSRSLGTTYRNKNPVPIFVCVSVLNGTPGATDYIVAEVNGVAVQGPGGVNVGATVSFPVPPSATYKVYNLYGYLTTVSAWAEYGLGSYPP